jgi:hypothetical protein
MPKLILNISSMGGKYGRSFTLPAFYGMISRVRSFEGLRLLKRDLKAMGKLLKLKPNEYLHAYENGHDKDWDGKRAWFALTALRRERLKAAVKGAEEKAAEKKAKAQASAALKREKAAAEKSAKAKARKAKKVVAAAMVQEAPLKIYARGVVSYFYFFPARRARALKIRQINSAILKVPDAALIR